jgi:hypothetical protein
VNQLNSTEREEVGAILKELELSPFERRQVNLISPIHETPIFLRLDCGFNSASCCYVFRRELSLRRFFSQAITLSIEFAC